MYYIRQFIVWVLHYRRCIYIYVYQAIPSVSACRELWIFRFYKWTDSVDRNFDFGCIKDHPLLQAWAQGVEGFVERSWDNDYCVIPCMYGYIVWWRMINKAMDKTCLLISVILQYGMKSSTFCGNSDFLNNVEIAKDYKL